MKKDVLIKFANVKPRANKLIASKLPWLKSDKIKPNQHLRNDIGLDDKEHAELMFQLSDEFNKTVTDKDWSKMHTVKDIHKFFSKTK